VIQDRVIICVASNWDDHPTSKHHVMRLLAEQNEVLWINYHASRRPRLNHTDVRLVGRRLRQVWAGPRRVAPRLLVLSPFLVPLPGLATARRCNDWILRRQVRHALRRLATGGRSRAVRRPLQLWLFTPDVPELIPRLDAERVVYYCVDDYAAFSGFDARLMEQLETRTLAASDIVVTTSPRLYERCRKHHDCVHLVPHGVDFEHFAAAQTLPPQAVPDELRDLPRPVFGYMGLIDEYVDLELIAAVARRRPDWSFALLGQVRRSTDVLAGLSNVRLLGPRPYQALPAYCRAFDVGLIPFRMNRLVRAVNPIKLREYLAAGLPVISAPLEAVLPYAPAVQTASTVEQFLSVAQVALRLAVETPARQRQELVRTESWRARVEELSWLVETLPSAERLADPRPADTRASPAPVKQPVLSA